MGEVKMRALRMINNVDKDGVISIQIPEELGEKVETIIFPVSQGYKKSEDAEFSEYVAEDGTEYRLNDWTDEYFNRVTEILAVKNDDTEAEEIFDV